MFKSYFKGKSAKKKTARFANIKTRKKSKKCLNVCKVYDYIQTLAYGNTNPAPQASMVTVSSHKEQQE